MNYDDERTEIVYQAYKVLFGIILIAAIILGLIFYNL